MARKNVCVIYDSDERYARSLMGVINDDNDIPYCAQVFTKKEELDRYMKDSEPEVLMINEEVYPYNSSSSKVLVLCENERDADRIRSEDGKIRGVCKYQPAYQLLNSMMDESRRLMGNRYSHEVRMIGVYGVNGGNRTLLSLAISKVLSERGRTLFVDLDQFSGVSDILHYSGNSDLSDAFYVFNQNKKQFHKNISNSIYQLEKLDFIPASVCAEDIAELDAGDFCTFLQGIGRELDYEYIVINVAEGLRAHWVLLDFCDEIYAPGNEDYLDRCKWDKFRQYLLEQGMESVVHKIVEVVPAIEQEYINEDFFNTIIYSELYDVLGKVLSGRA